MFNDKKVAITGASGNIASHVIDILEPREDIKLTLFTRNIDRLQNKNTFKLHGQITKK